MVVGHPVDHRCRDRRIVIGIVYGVVGRERMRPGLGDGQGPGGADRGDWRGARLDLWRHHRHYRSGRHGRVAVFVSLAWLRRRDDLRDRLGQPDADPSKSTGTIIWVTIGAAALAAAYTLAGGPTYVANLIVGCAELPTMGIILSDDADLPHHGHVHGLGRDRVAHHSRFSSYRGQRLPA